MSGDATLAPIAYKPWSRFQLGFNYQANTTSVMIARKSDQTWELWDNIFVQFPPAECGPGYPQQCVYSTYYNYNNSIWYHAHAPGLGNDYGTQTWCQPTTADDFNNFFHHARNPRPGAFPFQYNPWSVTTKGYNNVAKAFSRTFKMPGGYCGSPDSDGWTSIIQPYPSHLALDLYAPVMAPTPNGDKKNIVFAHAIGSYIDLEGNGDSDTTSGTGIVNGRRASLLPTLGGLIRSGELAQGFIPHALAAVIGPDMLACQPSSPEPYNFTAPAFPQAWPAQAYDQQNIAGGGACGSGGLYQNNVGSIPMGALLAIPSTIVLTPGMFHSCNGNQDVGCYSYVVALAAQDYGIYIVATGSPGFIALLAELNDTDLQQQNAKQAGGNYFGDLQTIKRLLQVVTSNGPNAIGGGTGNRMVTTPAPPFTY
jgi:hypothetical protein